MLIPVLRHGRMAVLAYGVGLAGILLATTTEKALAYTPYSPEVKAAIGKGIAFITTATDGTVDRLGARALQGYTLLLDGAPHSHPTVVAAAERLHKALASKDPAQMDKNGWDIYSTGLGIIFLIELDKNKYHSDIETLLGSLRLRQKPHGGWGYAERPTGDTSMTQYGVLSSWIAKNAGFNVPFDSMEKVANWLLKTQDPSGGFGYQGTVAEGALVAQEAISPSMSAAASGSLYICADFLHLIEKKEKQDEKLPSALKEIKKKEKEKESKERVKSRIDPRLVREAEERAKTWRDAHSKAKNVAMWVHYYLYALERCMSFRELYEHSEEKEPEWYNDGVDFLLKSQHEDGSWDCGQPSGPLCDTAFAVLFLMRSTKKKIDKVKNYGQGTMVGGRGIPKDTDKIELRNGNIVARPLLGPAEKLLAALDNPDLRDLDSSDNLVAQLPSDQIESLAAKYGDKIRDLVACKSPEARLMAVQFLAKTRDLDNVETLIYALTDPDYRVVRAANDGLLRIRRLPTVVVLPDNLSEEDRRLLVEKWKAWYQTIRPSAEVKY
jgi:hypothetical protein